MKTKRKCKVYREIYAKEKKGKYISRTNESKDEWG